jgi:Domain of unknown function (DUF6089)
LYAFSLYQKIKMRKTLLLLFILSIPAFSFAQYDNKIRKKTASGDFVKKKQKPYRAIVVGFGASNFLGELGGANQIGTHFVKDFEFSMTKPSFAVGYRYKFNPRFAVKGGFYYNLLSGDDKTTQEPYRKNRNLSFRSHVYELSVQAELYFTREQKGHLYKIKNAKGRKAFNVQGYAFVGIGGFYFNPQAKYKGQWVNLQPLGTEGQGLPDGPKKYSLFQFCIPYGLGAITALNREWFLGLEAGIRKTFTDYLDDVSGVYYDNDVLRSERGDMAANLADPSLHNYPPELGGDATGANQSAKGEQRGQPKYKDAYMFINLTLTYKLPNKKKTRSRF